MQTLVDSTADAHRPPPSLRLLTAAIWLCLPLLLIVTLITAIFTIGRAGLTGDQLWVDGWTGEVVVEHVAPSGMMQRHDLSVDATRPVIAESTERSIIFKSANVRAAVSGTVPRVIVILTASAKVALAWFVWINLLKVARSSLQGEVFTLANSTRLARLGGAAIAFPVVVWFVGRSALNSAINADHVDVTTFWVDQWEFSWFLWIGAGLLLLTVSRAFRWGVELQELEAATI